MPVSNKAYVESSEVLSLKGSKWTNTRTFYKNASSLKRFFQ